MRNVTIRCALCTLARSVGPVLWLCWPAWLRIKLPKLTRPQTQTGSARAPWFDSLSEWVREFCLKNVPLFGLKGVGLMLACARRSKKPIFRTIGCFHNSFAGSCIHIYTTPCARGPVTSSSGLVEYTITLGRVMSVPIETTGPDVVGTLY